MVQKLTLLDREKLFEYSELKIPVYLWLLSNNVDLIYDKIDYFQRLQGDINE